MSKGFSCKGYIFIHKSENYFRIIHPDGRCLEVHHYFISENDMKNWVDSRIS